MSTYTRTLKKVLETTTDIGLSKYPIFDDAYRAALNDKIIRHYFQREIGHETTSMFRYAMETKMGEIMPLYNQHYLLSLLQVDPLSTMSIKSITEMDSTGATTGTSDSTSKSDAKSRAVISDTPQTQLSFDDDYASGLQDNISGTTAEGASTDVQESTQTGTNDNTVTGYQGHAPMLILQARQALVNVDMLVIDELKELFMLIWQNNDDYTTTENRYGRFPYYGRY